MAPDTAPNGDQDRITTTAALSARSGLVRKPKYLSLFSGVGGIDLGLDRALHAYGNAVVPGVAEFVGRLIVGHAAQEAAA